MITRRRKGAKKQRTGPASFARVAQVMIGDSGKPIVGLLEPVLDHVLSGRGELNSSVRVIEVICNIEEAEILRGAIFQILAVIRASRVKGRYKAFDWTRETLHNQTDHAWEHIRRELQLRNNLGEPRKAGEDPHVEHALCRLAIFQALKARGAKR